MTIKLFRLNINSPATNSFELRTRFNSMFILCTYKLLYYMVVRNYSQTEYLFTYVIVYIIDIYEFKCPRTCPMPSNHEISSPRN